MRVEQFKGGDDRNLSYLLYTDEHALVIDPFAQIELYEQRADQLGVTIIGVLNTHTHADHTRGNKPFRKNGVERLEEQEVRLGEETIRAIPTPGHTDDSVCYYADEKLFTGDTLFVGKVGGTRDRAQARKQYESLHRLLEELPPDTTVYPGHDFGEEPQSTLAKEARKNPFLQRDLEGFIELKNNWQRYKQEHGIS